MGKNLWPEQEKKIRGSKTEGQTKLSQYKNYFFSR